MLIQTNWINFRLIISVPKVLYWLSFTFAASFTVFTLAYVKIIPFNIELLYASVIIGTKICYILESYFKDLTLVSFLHSPPLTPSPRR